MTTTRSTTKATNCFDCGTKITRSNATQDTDKQNTICDACWDYSGWENTHNDEGHSATIVDPDCIVCTGQKPEYRETKAGHTNGIAKSHTSHAGHDHPTTKAARAACRKATAAAAKA